MYCKALSALRNKIRCRILALESCRSQSYLSLTFTNQTPLPCQLDISSKNWTMEMFLFMRSHLWKDVIIANEWSFQNLVNWSQPLSWEVVWEKEYQIRRYIGLHIEYSSPPGIPLNSFLHISPKVLFLWMVHSIWSKGAHWNLEEGSMVRVLAVKA